MIVVTEGHPLVLPCNLPQLPLLMLLYHIQDPEDVVEEEASLCSVLGRSDSRGGRSLPKPVLITSSPPEDQTRLQTLP